MIPHDHDQTVNALGAILVSAGGRIDYQTAYLPDEDPDAPFTIVAYLTAPDGTGTEIAVVHGASLPEAHLAICEELERAGYGTVTVP